MKADDPKHALAEGLVAWNRGEPFVAHELFEAGWRVAVPGELRLLLHALAQLAAAGHKLATGQRIAGAPAILARARAKLDSLPPTVEEVDVARLARDVGALETAANAHLAATGRSAPPPLPAIHLVA